MAHFRFHKRFLKNKKGYSGIVATIFMVLVMLFLVFNVNMYMQDRDSALQVKCNRWTRMCVRKQSP